MQQSAAVLTAVQTGDRVDGAVGGVDMAPWVLALVLAGVGAAIDFDARPGVNWAIWTTIATAGLLWIARRRARDLAHAAGGARRIDLVGAWAAGLAVPVAWGAAVTANSLFQFFILVTCVTLLAVATRVFAGMPGRDVGIGAIARAPLDAGGAATREAGRRAMAAIAGARDERRRAVVRGVLLAAPVAVVFALILAGADPVLAAWRDALWDALPRGIDRVVFFFGLGTLALGAYGVAARATAERAAARAVAPRVAFGATERRVVVGAVAGVFGAFLLFQGTYLFRDVAALRVSGMTYAEYAHRGFVELTIAATMAVGLILALDRWGANATQAAADLRRSWGTLLLVAEVLIVLVSSFHRLTLYESAYGYTMLRLYVQAYVVGAAVTLVILAIEVARPVGGLDGARAARRTGVVAVGFLLVFSFGNPEAWVVRQDIARFASTGKLDTPYLADLSPNALPVLVEAMSKLPPLCAGTLRQDLGAEQQGLRRQQAMHHWYEWNAHRAQALAAFGAARLTPPAKQEMGGCYPGQRPVSP